MLAFLEYIVTCVGDHIPGNIDLSDDSFDPYPNGVAAFFRPDSIPTDGKFAIVFTIRFLELFVMKDVTDSAVFPGAWPCLAFRSGGIGSLTSRSCSRGGGDQQQTGGHVRRHGD